MTYTQKLNVPFNYKVHFTQGVFSPSNRTLKKYISKDKPSLCLVDRNVLKHHPKLATQIKRYLGVEAIAIPGGEQIKNSNTIVDRVGKLILNHKLCRHSTVIIVGGGAVLDAVGFAVAITHRGMKQVRIPTTVLSQNDSGVGVKNGINAFGLKNYYGTFSPPHAVINDSDFLSTLSQRDWCAGISEAFKVAIIKNDKFLQQLVRQANKLKQRDGKAMASLIKRCAALHLDHICQGGDPFETGSSRPLDFGHWSAHKLESLTKNKLRHGEAVAIGLVLDMIIAQHRNHVTLEHVEQVAQALQACGLKTWHPECENAKLANGITEFREHIGGDLCLTLPKAVAGKLGQQVEIHKLSAAQVKKAVRDLKRISGV